MEPAKSFRDLKVYQAARAVKAMLAEAWAGRRYKAAFVNKIDEALGEAYEAQSWLDDALDGGYLSKEDFHGLDKRYDAIGGMLSRMIDRADDFCKHTPGTDYRSIVREERESPFTDH
jgi:four helix bundle protein